MLRTPLTGYLPQTLHLDLRFTDVLIDYTRYGISISDHPVQNTLDEVISPEAVAARDAEIAQYDKARLWDSMQTMYCRDEKLAVSVSR